MKYLLMISLVALLQSCASQSESDFKNKYISLCLQKLGNNKTIAEQVDNDLCNNFYEKYEINQSDDEALKEFKKYPSPEDRIRCLNDSICSKKNLSIPEKIRERQPHSSQDYFDSIEECYFDCEVKLQ